MYLSQNSLWRIATLCVLYVAQGIPFGFVTITLAAFLAQQGASEKDVASLIMVTTLPWSFKWVWGPVIDRFGVPFLGRRRPWILLAQSFMAAAIVAILLMPDLSDHLRLLYAAVLVLNMFASLQDVSVDALAVDLLAEHERGKANGLMYASAYLGTLIGGAGLGLVVSRAGLQTGLAVQGVILLVIMLFPLLLRERPGDRLFPWMPGEPVETRPEAVNHSLLELFRRLLAAFSTPSAWLAALLALAVMLAAGLVTTVVIKFTVSELDWTQEQYSSVAGGGAVFTGLAGAVLGGFLVDRVGVRRLIVACSMALGAVWIGFALAAPFWREGFVVSGMIYTQEFLLSALSVSLFALFMGVSSPLVAGTQFTAYMALLNLSRTGGAWLAGQLRPGLSVPTIFLLAGGVQIGVLLLVAFIKPREATAAESKHGAARPSLDEELLVTEADA